MAHGSMSRLPPRPDLAWTPDGAPRSVTCDDVYFSRDGGLEETRAVFLAGCGLPERWAGRARFAIGELGFGAGLNALATWEMWRRTRAPGAVLHYVSIEGFPLERDEAARAHAAFPEIAALSARLLDQWPVRARGAQRLWFVEDGFTLTVIHADAQVALDGMTGAIVVDNCGGPEARKDLSDSFVRAADEGRPVLIYPEGHLSRVGEKHRYRSGVWHMQETSGWPVVPVATNLGLRWQCEDWEKTPGVAVIEFLDPIPAGLPKAEFMERLERAVEGHSTRLIAEGRVADEAAKVRRLAPIAKGL